MKKNTKDDGLAGWDPVWEAVFQKQEWGKYPPECVIRFVARNFYGVPDRHRIRLLDLGCGPGACTWFMAREGFDVCGIDGSATAIDRAQKRLSHEQLQADLRVGDFTSLPWPDNSFDGIIDNAALYANPLEATKKVMQQVHRVLKPGGLFLSLCFSDRTWGYGAGPCVETGSFSHVEEGPMEGKGFCRFAGRAQLQDIYSPLGIVGLETNAYTLDNMRHTVELWQVTCQKPSSSP